MLVPLKSHTDTVPCVGSNPPTITINDDPVCRQPIHAKITTKSDLSITRRSTVSRISEISNSQSQHILSILTLIPRGELPCNGFPKDLTFTPKTFTQDAAISMNMMHPNLNNTLMRAETYPAYHTGLQAQSTLPQRRHPLGSLKYWPGSLGFDLDPYLGLSGLFV